MPRPVSSPAGASRARLRSGPMRDVWGRVAEERVALADELGDGLAPSDWDRASRCRGWRVRDVVGHLVYLAEGTYPGWARDTIRHGRGVAVNGALDVTARWVGSADPAELLDRVRASSGGRFRAPGAPPAAALGEVVVHGEDVRRPLGLATPERDPADLVPVLRLYRRVGWFFTRSGSRGLRLVATDTDWAAGSGLEVRGPALELVLAMAGRAPSGDALAGDGVAALYSRTRTPPDR
jgi:uncharacterized protein (TIGR03083 family)